MVLVLFWCTEVLPHKSPSDLFFPETGEACHRLEPCKAVQLLSKPSTCRRERIAQKESNEPSNLCSVCMCFQVQKKVRVGGEGNICMFLWLMKGLPERQKCPSNWCVDDIAGQAEQWVIYLCRAEYQTRPLTESAVNSVGLRHVFCS